LNIRAATSDDIPFMIALERASPHAAHWTEEQYRALFSAGKREWRQVVLVAKGTLDRASAEAHNAETQLGFLAARRVDLEWELENIVVAASARRMGIGKRLLDALLAEAAKTHNAAVFLEVRESNAAARSLYEKAGFHKAGRRNSYYKNPAEDAILYRFDSAK
jgi:[ribosomal protein S18]-alanine N-acetyltransferase